MIEDAIESNTITTHNLLLTVQDMASSLEPLNQFIEQQSAADDMWHLWSNFVLKDYFAYFVLSEHQTGIFDCLALKALLRL